MEYKHLGNLDYDGSQLHHAFAYETTGILGPSIVSFIGKAEVKDHLVDLEDSCANDFIKSEKMVHFIIEIPGASIRETVVWQRYFIRMFVEVLQRQIPDRIEINGDDIMVGDRKMSVSIATLSQFSGLIHVGINICVGNDCPVNAIGLTEYFYLSSQLMEIIRCVSSYFVSEYEDITRASYKVIDVR